jgi:hypothetical protein
MVVVTAVYAAAVALLRPSNTLMDAALVSVNAAMGAAVAVAVLLLSPGVGAELAFAQGIAAVSTAVLRLLVVVLSGRALRRVHRLLSWRVTGPQAARSSCWTSSSSSSDAGCSLRHGTSSHHLPDLLITEISSEMLLRSDDSSVEDACISPVTDAGTTDAGTTVDPKGPNNIVSLGLIEPILRSELELLYDAIGEIATTDHVD